MRLRLSRSSSHWLLAAPLLATIVAGCQSNKDMAVTGLNPRSGHVGGDQTVEITGNNFRMDISYAVYFGSARAKAVGIRSPDSLVVTTPSGDVGAVDVTVRADDGNAFVLKQAFTYEDMSGSVVEGLGESQGPKEKGNLAF